MSLLNGIKVLDLSRILAGPWATQLLADYGAEVLKIEKPEVGDDTRHWGPPWMDLDGEKVAAYFVAANRNKQSLAIDIKSDEGQKLIKELVKSSDVFVENFKVGDLKRFGLDYLSLSKLNSKLIYCSISGFGQTGPLASQPGYDAMIQATGGLMSITGEADENGGKPTKVGVAVADLMTGMYAANGILAALIHRDKTGEGQHIDVSLFDCQLAMLANQGANYLATGSVPGRLGNAHPNIVPYQTFECSDGHIMIAVGNDNQFKSFCRALDLEEIANDLRYKTNAARVEHRNSLIPVLSSEIVKRKKNDLSLKLEQAGVPFGLVNNLKDALNHPQAIHRQVVKEFGNNVEGSTNSYVGSPVKFSNCEIEKAKRPPTLGENN